VWTDLGCGGRERRKKGPQSTEDLLRVNGRRTNAVLLATVSLLLLTAGIAELF
jgi:hypothetical protein